MQAATATPSSPLTRKPANRVQSACKPKTAHDHDSVTISLSGDATERHIVKAIACFRETLTGTKKIVVIDLSNSRAIEARFVGLLLMLRKRLKGQGAQLTFEGLAPAIKRMFRLDELGFLLSSE